MTRPAHDHEVRSEQVLARQLSAPQQIMMALAVRSARASSSPAALR